MARRPEDTWLLGLLSKLLKKLREPGMWLLLMICVLIGVAENDIFIPLTLFCVFAFLPTFGKRKGK